MGVLDERAEDPVDDRPLALGENGAARPPVGATLAAWRHRRLGFLLRPCRRRGVHCRGLGGRGAGYDLAEPCSTVPDGHIFQALR